MSEENLELVASKVEHWLDRLIRESKDIAKGNASTVLFTIGTFTLVSTLAVKFLYLPIFREVSSVDFAILCFMSTLFLSGGAFIRTYVFYVEKKALSRAGEHLSQLENRALTVAEKAATAPPKHPADGGV